MNQLKLHRASAGLLFVALLALPACRTTPLPAEDAMVLIGRKSFHDGYPARAAGGQVHVVVEIPAGSNGKWEVDKRDGAIRWEIRGGKPRVVQYLGYPANYGMVPSTLLPKVLGGDGDPLDVLLLGPAQPRGSVVCSRLIGVLKLLDGGEQDDKLIAVAAGSPFADLTNLAELNAAFPGVTKILEIWMSSYKGPGEMVSKGYADVAEAERVLAASIRAFDARQ